jgi:hypothetical protein
MDYRLQSLPDGDVVIDDKNDRYTRTRRQR